LLASDGNDVGANTVSDNSEDGIFLWQYCDNNTITGNSIVSNSGIGVYLRWSHDNVITDNDISLNNDFGIYLYLDTASNRIYHNNVTNNAQNAGGYSNHSNAWDDGYPSGGYWSDYMGSDGNADGIGDTPYLISETTGTRDDCPLMVPYAGNSPPNIPSNPWPANKATDVSLDIVLTWTGGDSGPPDTVTYDVYFGTSSSPPLVSKTNREPRITQQI
jgi:parallel beta-helix repeat protein